MRTSRKSLTQSLDLLWCVSTSIPSPHFSNLVLSHRFLQWLRYRMLYKISRSGLFFFPILQQKSVLKAFVNSQKALHKLWAFIPIVIQESVLYNSWITIGLHKSTLVVAKSMDISQSTSASFEEAIAAYGLQLMGSAQDNSTAISVAKNLGGRLIFLSAATIPLSKCLATLPLFILSGTASLVTCNSFKTLKNSTIWCYNMERNKLVLTGLFLKTMYDPQPILNKIHPKRQ